MQLWAFYNSPGRYRAPAAGRRHAAGRGLQGLLPDHSLLGVATLIVIGYDGPC
uniref:Uncharacterized protein n=1 Tax=Siphoviridae sp. ctvv53 TaxID=2826513 RepID=A0A8S5QLY4_9CAUD|nr:MAG TPA: hypothetical protein [Siphoviridae sp. ctvv53]